MQRVNLSVAIVSMVNAKGCKIPHVVPLEFMHNASLNEFSFKNESLNMKLNELADSNTSNINESTEIQGCKVVNKTVHVY